MTAGHSGGMADGLAPRSRARNLTELYVRAYWRYYVTAGVWTGLSTVVLSVLPPFSH